MDHQQRKSFTKMLSLYSDADIKRLCEPLALLRIHHFHFSQIFQDGSRVSISNNKKWLEIFYEEELFRKAFFFKSTNYYNGASAWYDVNESPIILKARDSYNITNNGISIAINKIDSCSLYHFATHYSEDIYALMNDNFALLYRFIDYFHEQFHFIIKDLLKVRILFPEQRNIQDSEISSSAIELFNQMTLCKKFYIDGSDCYLTRQEMKIIEQYASGADLFKIASSNCLSSKTVQTHLNNIKYKLGCKKTLDAIRFLQKISLL